MVAALIEGIGKIVVCSQRQGILDKGLAVIDFRLPVVFLLEVTVSLAHIPPVHLRSRRCHTSKDKQKRQQYV